ncbi:MAG: transcriptional repressor [Actinobacteria bacterium]|nr:transcriptional repressor [Actinomycetota bacterium]
MAPSEPSSADDLVAGLRRAGLRVTAPRRAVCAVLASAGEEHLTAADVAGRTGAAVDLSTVYRTLDALEGLGMVQHVHLGHGAGAYHVGPSEDHHHLVCEECGRTVDVALETLQRAIEGVTAPLGFVPDAAHFAIVGRCAACAGG